MKFSDRNANLSPDKQALLQKRLAAALESSNTAQTIQPRPDPSVAPMSFAQERLWFLSRLEPDNPTNNRPFALRFKGTLNVPVLERAFSEILNRHHILRTRLSDLDGFPVQKISPAQPQSLPMVDLTGDADPSKAAKTFAAQESQKTFVINDGSLIRACLLRLDEKDHVLLVVPHHMLFDAWSAQVFIREMGALYDVFVLDKPSPLPELPIQYPDYAYEQRRRLEEGHFEKQRSYWKEKLSGAPPYLELPTDYSRPAIQSYRGAKRSVMLSSWLTDSLHNLSRKEGSTLFMTLLAGFAVLLYRYTNHDDMVVGTPTAGRPFDETQDLIGFFVNTLALRIDLSANSSFRSMLGRIKETAIEAFSHQDLPFTKLVEELHLKRNPDQSPLFQAMFNLENVPRSSHDTKSVSIEEFDFDPGIAPFDLDMEIIEKNEGLSCTLTFNTALFEPGTAERMLGHYESLLEGIVANPQERISDLPLLSEVEKHQLLVEWNDTEADYPKDQCLHELFEAQVERTPDAVAVVFEQQRLTYRELNARANQLAHYLRKQGVGPEVLVGICIERSLEMVIGLLGVLKAGGAYVPLDPDYPKDRLAFMLKDSQAPVLLTQEKLASEFRNSIPTMCHIISLDSEWKIVSQESKHNPLSDVTAKNMAYVIYTSGSTGKPKGVVIPHQAICNHMFWMLETFSLNQTDKVLQKTPFSFDASVWEFYAPLLAGARLVMAQPGGHQDSEYLINVIMEQKVTILQLVPSLLQLLLEQEKFEKCHSLKRAFCGGEALSADLQDRYFQKSIKADLYNFYGPTEASINTVVWRCRRNGQTELVPIGRPITNTQTYILNSYLSPVPVGILGELHLGGNSLGRGYLNQSELTAERFIPNPFKKDSEDRLYKTGDLARYLPDGNIEFLGRIDHQVKIRGFRIELGEIEAVLIQHPAVQKTVAVVREDRPGDKRLVAYVVPNSEQAFVPSELRRFLKEKLPDYMIPTAMVFLDLLPLMPNGKVDRHALPAPEQSRSELETVHVAPQSEVERIIAEVWQQVLRIEQVGLHDNFFDLGGHSLLLIQIHNKFQEFFKKEIPIAEMFRFPTIKALADHLVQEENDRVSIQQTSDSIEKLTEGKKRMKKLYKRRQQTKEIR